MQSLPFDPAKLSKLTIVACGTAYYAGVTGKYWIEQLARIPVEADVASEFRYREPPLEKGGVTLVVSQSGETADTLAALRYAKSQGQVTIAIVNVPESTIAREADLVLPTNAGPEIGVASTKAFTCQLSVLAALSLKLAGARGTMAPAAIAAHVQALAEVPRRIHDVLALNDLIKAVAQDVAKARDVLFLGRGNLYPLALEGALKLKEISYIHAEGYAAGEMKHGPIALIDENVPVVVLAPESRLFEKTFSNLQEVHARGGQILLIGDAPALAKAKTEARWQVAMPAAEEFIQPLLYAVPVQLLAYHAAVAKGTDVDQPRNLAKSVTVE
jgi:glucosamine--fructose-6-phosphate aminotransferase (isomerizing)